MKLIRNISFTDIHKKLEAWIKKWAWFGLAGIAIYFLAQGELLAAMSGFALAFIFYPNARVVLSRLFSILKPITTFLFWVTLVCIGIYYLFNSIGKIGKYEGATAEEWFNRYDAENARYQALHDCVEPLAYSDNYRELQSIYYECF